MSNVSLVNGHIDRPKMTDEEVIKAWEKVLATGDAPFGEHWLCSITTGLAKETFDMLNRQKAENERLEAHNKEYRFCNLVDNVLIYSKTLEDYNNFRKAIIPKQGKWLINPDGYFPYCSECKEEPKGRIMTDFCPKCGADMRGK